MGEFGRPGKAALLRRSNCVARQGSGVAQNPKNDLFAAVSATTWRSASTSYSCSGPYISSRCSLQLGGEGQTWATPTAARRRRGDATKLVASLSLLAGSSLSLLALTVTAAERRCLLSLHGGEEEMRAVETPAVIW